MAHHQLQAGGPGHCQLFVSYFRPLINHEENETDGAALTGRFPACLGNEPDKAPLSATYTVSHSTGVSETTLHCAVVRSCHCRPAPFRSRFQNTRSVHRHSHISGAVLDVQLNEISGGFLEWESRSFWLDTIPLSNKALVSAN